MRILEEKRTLNYARGSMGKTKEIKINRFKKKEKQRN